MLKKPYYRIARPKAYIPSYATDNKYANDRLQLARAYLSIESKLKEIFDFIEPGDDNEETYSLELYTLFLRACTEVELNFKLILIANGYPKRTDKLNIEDYKNIEKSSKLSLYEVIYQNWRNKNGEHVLKKFHPFLEFKDNKSTKWYQDYNSVKHNREGNFNFASLKNCMNAVAGLLVILYSQFGNSCIKNNNSYFEFKTVDDTDYDDLMIPDSIFSIKAPKIDDWSKDELYDFDWDELCNKDTNPIAKYDFNSNN